MYINYNGQLLQEADLKQPLSNRAFQYNDGFFETMVWENGAVRFLREHLERMQDAASVLNLELPFELGFNKLEETIQAVAAKNECSRLARVKLKVWRSGEGLYTPQEDTVDWLLTAQAMDMPTQERLHLGICLSINTQPSLFSSFKGPNSLLYVMASREKKERQLDDLLLLDGKGHVSELTYSNIFWIKDDTLFTPCLNTGCLNGVMRRNLLKKATSRGWKVEEGTFLPEVLSQANVVFSSNVMGLRPVQSLEGKELPLDFALLEKARLLAFA